jgi:uncharacterized protein YdhG (YjbR/CyaY superfamily)
MRSEATTVEEYLESLPEDRKVAIQSLRKEIKKNLPKGFKEIMSYGMIGFVVPHSLYPAGYHCTPELPLPFMNIASQKNFIAVYHMGIYGDANLLQWFVDEYTKVVGKKPDMGKSCIRFKKPELIPFELFGVLASKISPQKWIEMYEKVLKRK